MTNTGVRRTSFFAGVAAFALLTLSGCINVTYTININPDASLSGTVQLAVTKQAASILGITDADDLNEKLKSGQLSEEMPTKAVDNCTASEDATNLILNCKLENAQASDLNEAWTMTVNGDTATFRAVLGDSSSAEAAGLPGFSTGEYDLTLTYPGPISSVTGDRAVKTGPNTVTVKGTLDEALDLTVVGSLNSGSSSMLWIYVLLGALAVGAIALLVFVLRAGSGGPKADAQPAIDSESQVPAIEATPETPEGKESGDQQ